MLIRQSLIEWCKTWVLYLIHPYQIQDHIYIKFYKKAKYNSIHTVFFPVYISYKPNLLL